MLKMGHLCQLYFVESEINFNCNISSKLIRQGAFGCVASKPENKRPVTHIVRYEKVIVRHNWFFAEQYIKLQYTATGIGETCIQDFTAILQIMHHVYVTHLKML
jgi:hypothetical protein